MTKNDLTEGVIPYQILKLALPVMGSSLFQMVYSMTDLFWIGKIGASAVTAVGISGYILWFVLSISLMPKVGVEIIVGQSIGRKDYQNLNRTVYETIRLTFLGTLLITILTVALSDKIILFFNITDIEVKVLAIKYLNVISVGFVFQIVSFIISGIFIGLGDSKTPFFINALGLVINIILDPLLIHGYLWFEPMGVSGAAYASVFAQIVVFVIIFLQLVNKFKSKIKFKTLFKFPTISVYKNLSRIGFPVAIQSILFSVFAMIVARIVARWGTEPIAVITIGANVEAVSWMTASGFSTALGTFVAQNYGASNFDRIRRGYIITILFSASIGILAGLLFYIKPEIIFSLFTNSEEVLDLGVVYLKIVAISQVFMCLEMTSSGVFNGIGKTLLPAFNGVFFNALRVGSVYVLAIYTNLNEVGAWLSISLSSVAKGFVVTIMVFILLHCVKVGEYNCIKNKWLRIVFISRLKHFFFDNVNKND